MILRLIRRAAYWLRRGRHDAELAEEMAFHRSLLARRTDDGSAGGRAFGNATLAREDARAVWIWRWAEDAWQDARYAARSMLRQPAFAAGAIVIVALGTGATTCVFELLDALVVKNLPVERPDRLVWLKDPSFSYPIFTRVHDTVPIFDGVFGWNIDRAYVDWSGSGRELMPADVLEVTPEFFKALRVKPILGRTLEGDDAAAIVSHAVWKGRFGGDASVVGRTIRVDSRTYTIAGVTPRGFFGVAPGLAPDVIVSVAGRRTAAELAATTSASLHIMGRLRDGLSIEQADATLQAIWPAIMEATTNPGAPADRRARYLARKTALQPGGAGYSRVRNMFADPLSLLMALVVLLLAIACASIANLLLARGAARRREIAVRLAIGAKRARVFRQLLTEAFVLTLAGAAIGLLLASWGGGLFVASMTTTEEHLALDTSPGWRLAAFTVALAVLVSIVSALLPSISATRGDVMHALKETGQPGGGLLGRWSAGKLLVAAQVALALVLLAGAAVFGRSLALVLSQETGLAIDRLAVVFPDAPAVGYEGQAVRIYHDRLLERLQGLPGIESAALSWMPPISNETGNWTQTITVDGSALPPTQERYVFFNAVSPTYLETVGTMLRRGRGLAATDIASAPRVVVINESLARRFFDGQDPLGHRISIGRGASRQDLEIVGIAQDTKYRTLQEPARSIAYLPLAQTAEAIAGQSLSVAIRASSLRTIDSVVREAARAIDPRVPIRIQTVADRVRESTVNERLIAALAAALGVAALILAFAGVYGLLAYAVSRHGREIGLRIALGARPASVLWMVQRESLALALVGIAAGLAGALALGRFVRTLLYQVTPADPVALGAASVVMLAAAAAAAFVPARRAASVDPVLMLKRE